MPAGVHKPMTGRDQRPVPRVVATVGTPFEAQRIVHLLHQRNLACLLRDQETMFSIGRGGTPAGIRVMVSAEDYPLALEAIGNAGIPYPSHPPIEA